MTLSLIQVQITNVYHGQYNEPWEHLPLSFVLPERVFLPGSLGYNASLGSYFSLQEATVQPCCIVSCRTTQDISAAVRVLTAANTTSVGKCQFAIRSGGHASFAGAANIQGDVTLDLSQLDAISLDEVSFPSNQHGGQPSTLSTVSVGVGAIWGTVYSYLQPHNLSVSGARAATVGVGGLLLGGGISYFGPRFGWACDGIVSLEVVLANGTAVNASAAENADLLWALRGGTNNVGIVTRVNLQTFGQGSLWGGFVVRPYSTATDEIAALADFADPPSGSRYDDFASLITTFAYLGAENTTVVVNNMEYTRPVQGSPPAVFQALTSLPALSSTQRNARLSDLAREVAVSHGGGKRQATATLTIFPTVAAITAAVRAWEASLPWVSKIADMVWGLGFDPLPPSLYARHPPGTNALGLHGEGEGVGGRGGVEHDAKALLIVQLTMTWTDAGDDGKVDEAARKLIATIRHDVSALWSMHEFVYVNYAAAWQEPFAGYHRTELQKLRRVKREYDPQGIFTELVPGGFKLTAEAGIDGGSDVGSVAAV